MKFLRFFTIIIIIIFIDLVCPNSPGVANDNKNTFNKLGILADSTLPADFPNITIETLVNPAPGYLFMESLPTGTGTTTPYLMILDSTCKPYWYYKPEFAGIDFKMQPNGLFSYGSPVKLAGKYQTGIQNVYVQENILNSNFKLIDTVQMQNGYLADVHDFAMLPNGNYLLIGYENNFIDMSKIVPGGDPNADVLGTVIQELDRNKNCIFQWRSLDYIPILDTKDYVLNSSFEHVHGSSLYLDYDGNLLISLFYTFEIIKIDMVTGNILWHLGGDRNQFAFKGEHDEYKPYYFTTVHDLKRLPTGNLLFYDNGTGKTPWYSRAVEYAVDEKNMTDSLIWEYRHTPDITSVAMGSAQRLSNGNTLIDWGYLIGDYKKTLTEVTPDKNITMQLSVPSDAFSYRAFKYDLPPCQPVGDTTINECLQGNTYLFNSKKDASNKTGVYIYFKQLANLFSTYNEITVKKYLCAPLYPVFTGESPDVLPCRFVTSQKMVVSFNGELRFDINTLPLLYNPANLKVYFRQTEGSGSFTELPTQFDTNNDLLIANTSDFGEYIIGFPRQATSINPPVLLFPADKKDLINNNLVELIWTPKGRYDTFNLQVSEDSLFTQIIIDSLNINTPIIPRIFDPNKTYYWRTKTFYRDLSSDWSDVHSFTFSEPFITIDYPNGGEVWNRESSYIIRWQTNSNDSISITLLRNGNKQAVVKDSLYSYTNAFLWKVPKNVPIDSTYKIIIKSLKDSTFFTESASMFNIGYTSVHDNLSASNIQITNYPNPLSDETTFEFTIENAGSTKISLFNIFGEEIQVIFDKMLIPGYYKFNWSSGTLAQGMYFYKITNGNYLQINKIVIVK